MKYPQTEDGRYFIVNGRKWRCSDPSLAEEDRQLFVNELSAARRDIKAAKKANDWRAEMWARSRVHAAKIALGERGPERWEPRTPQWLRVLEKMRDLVRTRARALPPPKGVKPNHEAPTSHGSEDG